MFKNVKITRARKLAVAGAAVAFVMAPVAASACPPVTPVVDCVIAPQTSGDSYTAVFGYNADQGGSEPVGFYNWGYVGKTPPMGFSKYNNNNIGQPTTFTKGVVHNAFTVKFKANEVVDWHFNGKLAHATAKSPLCKDTSVPASGSSSANLLWLGLLAPAAAVAAFRRRRAGESA